MAKLLHFTWMQKLIRAAAGRNHTPRTIPRRSSGVRCQPGLELLESRLTPAADISILGTGTGNLDHFLSATNGTITILDDPGDTNATLSIAALQNVGPGVNIDIQADNNITFENVGTLKLKTAHGSEAVFQADAEAITFNQTTNNVTTQGGTLYFYAGGNISAGNLNSNGGNIYLDAGGVGAGNLQIQNVSAGATGTLSMYATNAAGGNIFQSSSSATASALTIYATASDNITLNSVVGTTVNLTSTVGSVDSAGALAIQARLQLNVNAATGISINTTAASLSVNNSTSGDISITQVRTPSQLLTINGNGIVNQASMGSVFVDNLGAGIGVSGDGVITNNGAVTLDATSFQIGALVNSGSAITTLGNSNSGEPIEIGAPALGKINLTQGQLDEIVASVIRIGTPTAGAITISTPILSTAGWNTLTFINSAGITETAAGSLTVPNLRVSSAGAANLSGVNDVSTLAADATGGIMFNDGPQLLTVGVVDGDPGVSTIKNEIHLIADQLSITQQVSTGSISSGIVLLEPFTKNRSIDLGGTASGQFGLTAGELNEITAGVLRIGSASDTGNITIPNTISDVGAGWSVLDLINGGNIGESGGSLVVSGLALQGGKGVSFTSSANEVTDLAGTTASQAFSFVDSSSMAIAPVDGVNEISTGKGNVFLDVTGTLFSGSKPLQNDVVAADVTLLTSTGIGDSAQSLKLAVSKLAAYDSSGNIFLAESGTATLFGGLSASTGTINLTRGVFDLSANGQIDSTSSLSLSGATLNLGIYSDTIAALTLTSTSTLAAQINSLVAGHYGNLIVNGAIKLGGARESLALGASFTPPKAGTVLTLISNAGNSPVVGQFAGVPNNSTLTIGSYYFRLSYSGGTSSSVTLTYLS